MADEGPPATLPDRPLVLVVDDQASLRRLVRVNLELDGCEVVEAVDGVDCLERARARRPDLVTLDIVMPRMDGIETVTQLRTDPMLRDVPVVMVTTSSQPSDLARARIAGADGYLTKPYDPDELVATVRRLLRPR